MFFLLLFVTLFTALAVSYLVARMFDAPITVILSRIVGPELAGAWARYMRFAIYVVGVSGGVRIYALERYIEPVEVVKLPAPPADGAQVAAPVAPTVPTLTLERWVLEVLRTIIETLQALAWMLLVFFLLAMVAYIIVRVFGRHEKGEPLAAQSSADSQS